ncbi:MAG: hypothetical protein QUU85_17960, partial [Candidatus Eisenbacteria bacterium]|nr:hypothetical protein [Candidatus Eisenbacteria bacterium]
MRRMLLGPLQMAALGSLLLALLLVVPAFGQCPSHEGAGAGNAGTAESAGTEGTKEAAAVPAQAEPDAAQAPADETKAEVPELIALHEVIYPLWHEAWPSKNAAMIKELLPQVEAHVQAIRAAELPGILRDKKPA